MKVHNSITFGQSYVHPSIKNLNKVNQAKVQLSYAFGQLYPIDIMFGGTPLGNLTISMKRCNLLDYLTINDFIPCTKENIIKYYISKKMEAIGNLLFGNKYPVEGYVIKNLDNKSEKDIAHEINDKIADYNNKHGTKFIN